MTTKSDKSLRGEVEELLLYLYQHGKNEVDIEVYLSRAKTSLSQVLREHLPKKSKRTPNRKEYISEFRGGYNSAINEVNELIKELGNE